MRHSPRRGLYGGTIRRVRWSCDSGGGRHRSKGRRKRATSVRAAKKGLTAIVKRRGGRVKKKAGYYGDIGWRGMRQVFSMDSGNGVHSNGRNRRARLSLWDDC